jgi:hypothetical protein
VPGPPFDLAGELRPALLRLGDRLAWALVRLDDAPDRAAARAAVADELAPWGLDTAHAAAVADAIAALVHSRANARASSPAITGSTSDAP